MSPRTPRMSFSCSSRTRRSESGSVAQPLDAVLERDDVVADLAQVCRTALDRRTGLGGEQLAERRLRALDAAREHRLAPDERADQQMRIRQPPALAGQPADRAIRGRERGDEAVAPFERRRQRRGHEGPVAAGTTDPASVPAFSLGSWHSLVCDRENNQEAY